MPERNVENHEISEPFNAYRLGAMLFYCAIVSQMFMMASASAAAGVVVSGEVWDHQRLWFACLSSAIIWGALATALFPPPAEDSETNKIRRLLVKFGASAFGGATFGPGIIDHFNMPLTVTTVVWVTAITSLFIVTTLHKLAPKIEKLIDRHIPDK